MKGTIRVDFQAAATAFIVYWSQAISAFLEMERQYESVRKDTRAAEAKKGRRGRDCGAPCR